MILLRSLLVVSCVFFGSKLAAQEDGSGLKVSAAADIVGDYKTKKDSKSNDRTDVREAEILLTAPIDHRFIGQLSFAAHRENGEQFAEVHEAFILAPNLIPRSNIKAGQFFLGVGRLNRFHRHEWYFTNAPKVQKEFFDEEAASDTGVEYSYLMPLPFYLNLSAGVTNGYTFGHSHDDGKKPTQPTHYARLSTFHPFLGATGAQTGLNYLGRRDSDRTQMSLVGLDFLAKWKQGTETPFLIQSEVWFRTLKTVQAPKEDTLGLYVFPQVGFNSELFFGVLYDYYTVLTLKNALGKKLKNYEHHVSPTLTYKASEFSTLRLAYDYGQIKEASKPRTDNAKIVFQATFIIGAHPAHEF